MSSLEACQQQYEADLARQTRCCMLQSISAAHRAANRRVFEKLVQMQKDLSAKGPLPFVPDSAHAAKRASKETHQTVVYPENLLITSHRQLKQVLPIPDIHRLSDCDTIYRFLIARRMDEALAVQDILHYIAFREKYNLDHILWDPELESMFSGLDGEELVREVMSTMAKKGGQHGTKPVPVSRPLLQPGFAACNCGVDRQGRVLLYQRPQPRDLAMLVRRWPHVEGQYDCRNPDFFSVTRPYSNLLMRLYLRTLEKGRRLTRLLEYQRRQLPLEAAREDGSGVEVGGGLTCLTDVGAVKVSHFTSSKYKDAFRLFRLVSHMGQMYYPENLSRFIIINGGFVFKMVYKLIRPWLDPQTQKKIILLSESNKVGAEEMGDVASPKADVAEDDESDSEDNGSEKGGANLALHKALLEFIDDKFIPSTYGGKLQTQPAPLFYGGAVPKVFAGQPYLSEACARISAKVVPELLPDEFLLRYGKDGMPIDKEEGDAFANLLQTRFP